jgi:protein TonB
MFEAFETRTDVAQAKRLALSGAASMVLFALGAVGLAYLAAHGAEVVKKKVVDVTFRKPPPVVKVEPKPPPPPPPAVKPKPKPVVAEVVAPVPAPAPAPIVVPKEIPKEKPPETDAASAVSALDMAVGGTGDGTGPAAEPDEEESAAPVVASAGGGPVNLPEDADPPEPFEENAAPEYPEAARATGEEAQVVLKIVVQVDGTVGAIKVMKGDDPFLTEALEKVKTWRYEPAQLDGEPIAVFKIVNIKFRLRS